MGEQLICRLDPTSDIVKKQLTQLKEQWQSLKRMATDQTRTRDGVESLQDLSNKVEKLEARIKEKVWKILVLHLTEILRDPRRRLLGESSVF